MTNSPKDLIETYIFQVEGVHCSNNALEGLNDVIHKTMGHDGSYITPQDVSNALNAVETTKWSEVAWACKETLPEFATNEPLDSNDFIIFLGIACILSEAVRRKQSTWSGSADLIASTIVANSGKGPSESRETLYSYIFRT